ncbi:hypothetical protein [Providencia huashanensis]
MNPRGRGEFNIKSLDTIQEHINNKFNLASPKDGVRVSNQNHANVLSRMKGDLFSEAKSEFKKTLILDIDSGRRGRVTNPIQQTLLNWKISPLIMI